MVKQQFEHSINLITMSINLITSHISVITFDIQYAAFEALNPEEQEFLRAIQQSTLTCFICMQQSTTFVRFFFCIFSILQLALLIPV